MINNLTDGTTIKLLALCCFSDVHPRLMEALLGRYRSIDKIFKADAGSLMTISGVTAEMANTIANATSLLDKVEEYCKQLSQRDISVVSRFDEEYPQRLFELNDPPSVLFYRGKLPKQDAKTVALVGSERSTGEGVELTVEVARKFAEAGVQIISSLGRGIDSAAHLGSKAGGGQSFSVLSSGFDNIYPEENRPLAVDVAGTGGLLSEYRPDVKYHDGATAASNRIIAALAQAVVVTELYDDSGYALDLLKCCSQIGKLAFLMIDPRHGALTDERSLSQAYTYGAIPMVGLDKVQDIIVSLV